VEAEAVCGRVVEPALHTPAVLAETRRGGVPRHLQAQIEELRPVLVDGSAVGELALGHGPPCSLTLGPVRILQNRTELHKGRLLPLPLHRLATDDLVVLHLELGDLGIDGHVLVAVELRADAHFAEGHLEPLGFYTTLE